MRITQGGGPTLRKERGRSLGIPATAECAITFLRLHILSSLPIRGEESVDARAGEEKVLFLRNPTRRIESGHFWLTQPPFFLFFLQASNLPFFLLVSRILRSSAFRGASQPLITPPPPPRARKASGRRGDERGGERGESSKRRPSQTGYY